MELVKLEEHNTVLKELVNCFVFRIFWIMFVIIPLEMHENTEIITVYDFWIIFEKWKPSK